MVTEQDKTLEAIQTAIQMEIDGKEYYQKASQSSDNQLGKELFQSLATEEDIHRQKFESIYNAIRNKRAWPEAHLLPDQGRRLRTIFAKATEKIGSNIKAPATELDALQTAMDMENKTYDFYKSQSQNTDYEVGRNFYETLATQERGHHQVLLDYYEYLTDPSGWFVKKERHSLNGG